MFTPILNTLAKLRDDLATGAKSVISRDDLADVDNQINNVVSIRADFGAKINRIIGPPSRGNRDPKTC